MNNDKILTTPWLKVPGRLTTINKWIEQSPDIQKQQRYLKKCNRYLMTSFIYIILCIMALCIVATNNLFADYFPDYLQAGWVAFVLTVGGLIWFCSFVYSLCRFYYLYETKCNIEHIIFKQII